MAIEYRRIQLLRGSEADWATNNIVLLLGEAGIQIEPSGSRAKIGDGVTPWSDLPWAFEVDASARSDIVNIQGSLDDHDNRLAVVEAYGATISDLQTAVDANTTAISNLEGASYAGNNEGDLLAWDGATFISTSFTLVAGSLPFWNAAATEWNVTGAATEGQVLQASSSGLPSWSSTLKLGAGSITVPAVGFLTDPDTGFYLAGTNAAGITAGGISRMSIGARITSNIHGDGANGYTTIRFDKDESGEVIIEATDTVNSATKHTINLNKYGGSVLINDAAVSSSLALKRDVEMFDDALSLLSRLPVITFRRKHGDNRRREIGFSAEAVAEHVPAAASVDADGKPNGVFLADMLAIVARSAQQLGDEIARLRARIAQLERERGEAA
jgi:hypothetical protein